MPTLLKLSLDNPCSENWDAMSTVTTGRFCQSCQKTVTDFSQFTDSELMDFFKKRNYQPLCGRIQQHRINKIYVELPSTLFKSRVPFWKKFLAICLVVFGSTLFTPESSYSQAVMTVNVVNHKKVKSKNSKKKKKWYYKSPKKDFTYIESSTIFFDGLISAKTIPFNSAELKQITEPAFRETVNTDTISATSMIAHEEKDNKKDNKDAGTSPSPMIATPAFRLRRPSKIKQAFKKK